MEFKDKQAIYLQIADYLCEQILLGKWPPGERIPSVRDLAGMLEVNPNTVMRTYDFLQNKEIIYNKRGIGYSADENALAKILAYRKERFLEIEMPEVFRTLHILNISMEELGVRYEKFIAEHFPVIK
ncbi:HTH-type transcriptional repressor YtrA [Dyadobacter sp. CECT 9623]|uniref:HTH-type transcriptional repressor YtrA n=1 Tax=Dyadobacter linearis TaxID=2823330 RepID=A0ABM8UVL5_9BACT|nr:MULTISPECIES: GntR family transcriptional regulator [unclassified Dyadobacter]MCE7059177.1 GntR family transcriptional regulator [Dyadobacter sp. CY343]CAG5072824.1 HTH-type transcriptional repressor YtrA [Dyadobacter sp. CECT 9623]